MTTSRSYWLEVVGLGLVSALLYRFGLLLLVFMVPVQIVWVRRGERAGLTAAAVFLAVQLVLTLTDLARVTGEVGQLPVGMALIGMLPMVASFGGLYLLNRPTLRLRLPTWQKEAGAKPEGSSVELHLPGRLIVAAVLAAAVFVPLFVYVGSSGSLRDLIGVQLAMLEELAGGLSADQAEIEALLALAVEMVLASFLVGFAAMLLVNWWLGIRFVRRARWAAPEPNPVAERVIAMELKEFRLADAYVWVLIAGWASVAASVALDTGAFRHVAWNVALPVTLLFGLQGLAVLWHLLGRKGVGRQGRVGVGIALTVSLMLPVVNVVVLVGIPGLGVSEIWVDYHRFERSESSHESDTE